jgi:hypothetical protein
MNFAKFSGNTGEKQDALGNSSFSGINMCGNPDISYIL